MSTRLAQSDGVELVQFAGGTERGLCVQIAVEVPGDERGQSTYIIQLTRTQAGFVRDELTKWMATT